MLGTVFAIPPVPPPTLPQQAQTKEQTVYTTKTGKKYHQAKSGHLPLPVPEYPRVRFRSRLIDAQAPGLTACSVARGASGGRRAGRGGRIREVQRQRQLPRLRPGRARGPYAKRSHPVRAGVAGLSFLAPVVHDLVFAVAAGSALGTGRDLLSRGRM
jgi:hypothetical protein